MPSDRDPSKSRDQARAQAQAQSVCGQLQKKAGAATAESLAAGTSFSIGLSVWKKRFAVIFKCANNCIVGHKNNAAACM
jgi:hypothetical protein